ncbi:MAG: FISUMP domain-containing protein [Winogradskyella sp.]|uniref:FISUMP domain-containing protein n=1 Tax=uncultured Polaribacter sp. TaxID=174711 RepID=UPI002614045F|nr:FISUMP domain-containing protein [uncultured Polaribacter sp.]
MKKVLLSIALIATSFTTVAQVGIGTTTPEGALDVVSTNSALILPRVANTAAVATPVNGMLVYDLSTNCFKGYQNGGWSDCGFAPSAAAVAASTSVLSQIGSQADSPDTENAVVTAADLSNILPAITGVEAANQTAYQDYIDANPGSFSSPATQAEVQAMVDVVAPQDVVSSDTGKTWHDRNLGAMQVAISSTDAAAYGDLYQWGRAADGHQFRTNTTTTSTLATTSTPGHGSFIIPSAEPYNWLTIQDNSLWQGVSGTNNPCPSGYRLPTATELENELTAWGGNHAASAFASALKLPLAGMRNRLGSLVAVGSAANYWSSTVSGTNVTRLSFGVSTSGMYDLSLASGISVRCIKD